MSKSDYNERPKKIKFDKFWTRAKSERKLAEGMDPETTFVDEKGATKGRFTMHPNMHVRVKAWKKMGCPLPESREEQDKFLVALSGKELPKDASQVPAFIAQLRWRFLREPMSVAEDTPKQD